MSEPKKLFNEGEAKLEQQRLTGWKPQQGQLERIMAERRKNARPLMTYGGRDFTGQGPYDL